MLRREPALENMLREMRAALYDMVGDYHLTEIGIQTSKNYRDRGKLVLSDGGSVLREAIASDPNKVAEIFSRCSDVSYSPNLTAEQRAQRYRESGLAHRLSDILNDNIRVTRITMVAREPCWSGRVSRAISPSSTTTMIGRLAILILKLTASTRCSSAEKSSIIGSLLPWRRPCSSSIRRATG